MGFCHCLCHHLGLYRLQNVCTSPLCTLPTQTWGVSSARPLCYLQNLRISSFQVLCNIHYQSKSLSDTFCTSTYRLGLSMESSTLVWACILILDSATSIYGRTLFLDSAISGMSPILFFDLQLLTKWVNLLNSDLCDLQRGHRFSPLSLLPPI